MMHADVLVSLLQGWRTVMFKISGFYTVDQMSLDLVNLVSLGRP